MALIGGTLNIKHVRAHWDEILRLATLNKQGTVTASLMLRKLGSYLSPLGWEHIILTGDYVWRQNRRVEDGQFRPLRLSGKA